MNDNQNAFVTRSTSRVLAAPGGKSSVGFLFGGGAAKAPATEKAAEIEKEVLAKEVAPENETKSTAPNSTTAAKEVAPVPVSDAISEAVRIKQKNESQHFSIFGGTTQAPKESSNAFASASTTNSYNVLTDRPTSRVLRPPGGQSSIRLG
mmetsp:Transcript_2457/g.3755  ORF Transcript_2457/g.3755 Transcript_2457/m.3755 type:complete len:150 (-) Transcript_2457:242-691(-)